MSKSERDREELEQTQMLRTMIVEPDDDAPSILEEIEEFEERIDYLDVSDEEKDKLRKLVNEIKSQDDENVRKYLFNLLQDEVNNGVKD